MSELKPNRSQRRKEARQQRLVHKQVGWIERAYIMAIDGETNPDYLDFHFKYYNGIWQHACQVNNSIPGKPELNPRYFYNTYKPNHETPALPAVDSSAV